MHSIKYYIANSTGELNKLTTLITGSMNKVIPEVEHDLNANKIDIIFVSAARLAIPEYGIGGNSPGPHHVYVAFDPKSNKITQQGLDETLYHEIHHCMRWRNPGYGESLGEAMISEGLACLYEEQKTGNVPIYARVKLDDMAIKLAKQTLNKNSYNHAEWFFGSKKIDRWFGYSYGYKLCKEYSAQTGKSASDLVNEPAQQILKITNRKTTN